MASSAAVPSRLIRACQRCRKLKVSCDRAKPRCAKCAKADTLCEYVPAPGGTRQQESPGDATDRMHVELPRSNDNAKSAPKTTTEPPVLGANPLLDDPLWHSGQSATSGRPSLPISRDRAILSCIRCRRHKLRCDRKSPCGRCKKLKKEMECFYSVSPVAKRRRILPADEKTLAALDNIAITFADQTRDLRFRNGTHWDTLLDEISKSLPPDLSLSCGAGSQAPDRESTTATAYTNSLQLSINFPFGDVAATTRSVDDALSQLPSQSIQDVYVARYLATVEKAYRLLNPAEFQREVRDFWEQKCTLQYDWLAQYFTILSLGCHVHNFIAQARGDQVRHHLPAQFLNDAELCLKRTPFLCRPSFSNIRTLCLMAIAKQIYAMSCHEADACWHLTGMAVRLCLSMGIHVRPAPTDRRTHREIIMARRLWAVVLFLEMRQSLVCGMPLLLRPSDVAYLTTDLDTPDSIPSPRDFQTLSSMQDDGTRSLIEDAFVGSGQLLLKALELATCPDNTVDYAKVVEVDAALRQHLKCTDINIAIPQFSSDKRSLPLDLEACTVNIFFRQVLMALHSQFSLQPVSCTLHPVSYVSSRESALSLLFQQRNLAERDPWAQESTWLAGFFRHEFFTAAMTVCCQLVRSNDLLELPSACGYESQPRDIMLDALQSCRDVWNQEKKVSACNSIAFVIVDNLVQILRRQLP